MGALAQGFLQLFLGRRSGDDGHALGNEVVASVAVLDSYHVVFEPEVFDVFYQYDFHVVFPPVFTSTYRLRRAAAPGDGHA